MSTTKTLLVCSLLAFFAVSSGCHQSGQPDETPVQPAAPRAAQPPGPPLTLADLKNAAYTGFGEGKNAVTLVSGVWETPANAVSRSRITFAGDWMLHGDIDGDGSPESVVMLAENTGGSGEMIYLAAVKRKDDVTSNVVTSVGDRVQLVDGKIEDRKLKLTLVQAGPDDAMCCPGELVQKSWEMTPQGLKPVENSQPSARATLAKTVAGTEWRLKSWTLDQTGPPEAEVTLRYEDGRFVGVSGCNNYNAPVTESGSPGSIKVGMPVSTRKACPPPAMKVEARYLKQLGMVNKYSFLAGTLALTYTEAGLPKAMIFERKIK